MIDGLRRAFDAWRGAGVHSVTVPPMDGVLSPNQAIEEAPVLVAVDAPDNLVSDGRRLMFSSGDAVMELRTDGLSARTLPVAGFDSPVSALALHPGGALAVGLDDGRVVIRGGDHDGKVLTACGGRRIVCPTALLFDGEDGLFIALGSQTNGPGQWRRDLLERNASGSVWRLDLASGDATCLGDGLGYPSGLMLDGDTGVIISESWRNRLLRIGAGTKPTVALNDIAGYPSRITRVTDGRGAWLSVFAPRSQLVEFVLRERDYRETMMAEIDPRFWIAPTLSAAQSFLEPMQFGGLRQLGMLKPWSPTRSYGLVVGLDGECQPERSFHSRADGRRHGITSALDFGGRLIATSKGGNAIVSIPLAED